MSDTLIAKPIIKNQYWVVTDGDKKVGNVQANGTGYDLIMNGNNIHFKDKNDFRRKTRIQFQTLKTDRTQAQLPFSNYPTTPRVYNSILDVKRKLHLYTKTQKSKCYYSAGWYVINQTGENKTIFCPKYIFIQRYPYLGPFKTEEDAISEINNL